jgi:hypothetical protein
MQDRYAMVRVRRATARKLKALAAIQGESVINLVERLVVDEAERSGVQSLLDTVSPREQESHDRYDDR